MTRSASERENGAASVCRTCLSSNRPMLPLETSVTHSTEKTLLECLRQCTMSEVPLRAGQGSEFRYPTQICLRCSKALQVSYHFIKLTLESEATLREQAARFEAVKTSSEHAADDVTVTTLQSRKESAAIEMMTSEAESNDGHHLGSNELQDRQHESGHLKRPYSQTTTDRDRAESPASTSPPQRRTVKLRKVQTPIALIATSNAEKILERTEQAAEMVAQQQQQHQPAQSKRKDLIDDNSTVNSPLEAKAEDCLQNDDHHVDLILSEHEVLTEIENQSDSTTVPPPTVVANQTGRNEPQSAQTNRSSQDDDHNFIEEIKENLTNEARDLKLIRNKARTLEETKQLHKALQDKEAEIDNNELVCMQCDKRFTDMHIFIRHRNRHKGITPFRCNFCNFFTCYSESLRKHYKKEHNMDATNDMLNTPIDPHDTPAEKPYFEITFKCMECTLETHKEQEIQKHLAMEHLVTEDADSLIVKYYNCPDCHRTFKDRKAMRTHFTLMHGTSLGIKKLSTETYICEYCDKHFQFKASLVSHMRVCRLREAVSCNFCKKKFSTVRKFEVHLRAEHAVATIHECEVCGKAFNNTESLSLHRKRHSERHFQCEHCPRNYVNNSELKVHVQRMHAKEAKELCRICGMTFTYIGLLRDHENKEHLKKLIKCIYCDFKSPSRYSVRLHQYMHTGKPYKCAVCDKEFALRADMRRHSLNVHSIELSDEELAEMFRKKFGYPSRYDAFSKDNNNLEIVEVNEDDVELELKEYGLSFKDIMKDLFDESIGEELFKSSQQNGSTQSI